ncbi:MAG: Maf family protein [Verrucomicrobiota bacterium]
MPSPPQPSPLILASSSPRRRDLLNEANFSFTIIPSPAEEIHDASLPPHELTEHNARLKAQAVAPNHPNATVIGADTLVFIDHQPLGKPRDLPHAIEMLETLTGRTHQVCTGVCLTRHATNQTHCFHEITHVTFLPLTRPQIESYLEKINPLDKAGAYAAQDHGNLIIEKTEGSWTNVVGLPITRLKSELTPFLP